MRPGVMRGGTGIVPCNVRPLRAPSHGKARSSGTRRLVHCFVGMTEPLVELRFPVLGADVTRATLVEWVKRAGDRVKAGDTVAIVDTRKGAVEIDATADGVLEHTLFDIGAQLQVGVCLATISLASADSPVLAPPPPIVLPPPASPASNPGRLVTLSPRAQKLAADLNVDLTRIQGTGPNGSITS